MAYLAADQKLITRGDLAKLLGLDRDRLARNEKRLNLTPIHLNARVIVYRRREAEALLKAWGR